MFLVSSVEKMKTNYNCTSFIFIYDIYPYVDTIELLFIFLLHPFDIGRKSAHTICDNVGGGVVSPSLLVWVVYKWRN